MNSLLSQVANLTRKNNEFLDKTGGRFNLFQVVGVNHYENTHSAILAELLDPKGSHGLEHLFLQAFTEEVGLKDYILDFDSKNATVKTEVAVGNGRIDILIDDNKGHAVIVENKIYAGDQWEQLKRYDEFATQKYGSLNYRIFYLTLNGSLASTNSRRNIVYSPISYANSIILWLDKCVNLSSRFPLVRETLNQYINHLKKLTNQDMDTKNKEEIVKILSSSEENVQAAFSIFENIGALKDIMVSKHFNPQLQEIADELGIKVSCELKGRKNWVGFGFDVPQWNYFSIYFEFDESDWMKLSYEYILKDLDKKPIETIAILYPKFERHSPNKKIPCGYSYQMKYSNWNIDAYLAMLSGEMKNEIKKIVMNMIEQAKDLEM